MKVKHLALLTIFLTAPQVVAAALETNSEEGRSPTFSYTVEERMKHLQKVKKQKLCRPHGTNMKRSYLSLKQERAFWIMLFGNLNTLSSMRNQKL